MTGTAVRVALRVAEPAALPPWIVRLLENIAETDSLECCGLIRAVAARGRKQVPPIIRLWMKLEQSLAARSTLPAPASPGLPIAASESPEAIAALSPDVIVDLSGACGLGIDPGLARHGIWFADCMGEEPGLAGLRSLLRREPVNPLSLFRRVADDGRVRTIATGAVNPKYIAARNEWFLKEKSVALILRELRRLALTGSAAEAPQPPFEPFVRPAAGEFAAYLAAIAQESARRVGEQFLARSGFRPGMFLINSLKGDLPDFDPVVARPNPPGPNVYHADPFLWQRGGESYCFFETFDYRSGKGHISVGRWAEGRLTDIRTALATDYHLSFPFLLEHEGELFMMPESCAAKRLEVWRCTRFPDQWELHSTAMEGVMAADSTLAEIDGQWWLFANISADPFGDMNSELHLFQVDGPSLGAITPHPLNPVTFDARSARNAGRIIRVGDTLLRPAQENSHGTYGYGLNLMQIETLSMEAYSERLVRRIRPDFGPGLIGCHHLDMRDGLIVFDARRRLGGRTRNAVAA